MMKKLAVAVFALSLSAFGCGSDDGGKNDAAPKLDGLPGVEVLPQTDTPLQNDAPQKFDVTPDSTKLDVAIDQGAKLDTAPVDTAAVDTATIDQAQGIDGPAVKLDGGTLDTQAGEAGKAIDGGIDGGSVG